MDMQNATALPTPLDVASAWRKLSPNLLVVSSHRWMPVVQMTRTSVRTYGATAVSTTPCRHLCLQAEAAGRTYGG